VNHPEFKKAITEHNVSATGSVSFLR